jgi:tetratricopeptide (TPR) repeat protein
MHRFILLLALVTAALYPAPSSAQQRNQLGPLCTTDTTPADQQIDACNKIIALKVFSGEKLATIYFWRAVGWNKKGNYTQVIADASEAIRLAPNVPSYNLRGSAYYDKGEYDIAIADFNDALRMGATGDVGIIYHNRGNAWRSKGEYAKAIADYDVSIDKGPKSAFSYQNRGASKQAPGDIDGALADMNEAIRIDPALPQPLTNRAVIWRAKGDFDRAIADVTEAIRLAKAKAPVNIMTPPGSVLISAYAERGVAYEAKGDYARAKQDPAGRRFRYRQQGQPGHRQGALVAAVGCRDAAHGAHFNIGADTDGGALACFAAGGRRDRSPRGARHRQRRLHACQGAAQSLQRCAHGRQEPARHRLCRHRRHRSRSRRHAEHDPRIFV